MLLDMRRELGHDNFHDFAVASAARLHLHLLLRLYGFAQALSACMNRFTCIYVYTYVCVCVYVCNIQICLDLHLLLRLYGLLKR